MERTLESVKAMEHHFLVDEKDTVNGLFTVTGFSFSGRGQNTGLGFANLKDWSIRGSGEGSVFAIARRAMKSLSKVRDAHDLRLHPAGHHRAWQRQRLRLAVAGPRRAGP